MYTIKMCDGCGWNVDFCECVETEIEMTDNYLSDDYVHKRVLRKLIEKWGKVEEVGGSTYTKRCIEDIYGILKAQEKR